MKNYSNILNDYIDKFKRKQVSHPNISNLWLSYLELKKMNYDEKTINQCSYVLDLIEKGQCDLKHREIVSLYLYKKVML